MFLDGSLVFMSKTMMKLKKDVSLLAESLKVRSPILIKKHFEDVIYARGRS